MTHVPERDRDRAGDRPGADHGRQLPLLGDRGGAEVHPGEGNRQLDQPEGRRGGVPRPGPRDPATRGRRRRDGLRRGGPGGHRRAQGRDLRTRLPAAARRGLPPRGHRVRPERPRRRDRDRGAQRLRDGVHRITAADQGALSRRTYLGRDLEPLVRLPRQRGRPRGDALGVPLPRHPQRPRHGHRQRGPADRLRGHRAGAARARRGRALRPQARRHRAAGRARGHGFRRGDQARGRPVLARARGRGAALVRARPRDRRVHRGGRGGGEAEVRPPAGGDRRPADGGDANRRRPVRLRADVPAAGGEERAGDEAGRCLSRALHGGGEGRRQPRPGDDRARHCQG